MPRHIAFLRAINVGGHTVQMARLRALFESLGFASVETFIASGNVVFDTRARVARALEQRIAGTLREALGYDVDTFLRTPAELAAAAAHEAFPEDAIRAAAGLNVVFLGDALDASRARKLMALRTDNDDLHVNGREIYWLARTRQSDSRISNAVFERTLGLRSTARNITTVRKMAERYGVAS